MTPLHDLHLRHVTPWHALTAAVGLVALLLLAGGLALAPWSLLLALLLTVVGSLLYLRIPWLGWIVLAFLLPISSGLRIGPATATELLLAAAIATGFAAGVVNRRIDLTQRLPLWPLYLYLLVLVWASLGAADLREATSELLKWVEFGLILLIVPNALPRRAAHWLVAALLLAAAMQAVWGLAQFFLRIGPDWFLIQGRFMRASGSFRQPNPFGGFLGLMLPVAVSLTLWCWFGLWQRLRHRTLPHTNWLLLIGLTTVTLLIGAGLGASWSRGAWLGAVAGLIAVLAFWNRATLFALIATLTAAALAGLAGMTNPTWIPAVIAARVRDLPTYFGLVDVLQLEVNDDNFAVIERMAHWVAAWRMWARAPWLGIGPGNYALVYPEVALPRWPDPLGHAHNIYLHLLAESGLIGLLTHILLWATLLIWLIRGILSRPSEDWTRALAVGVLGAVAHLTVHSIFDNLYVQGMYLVLAFWFAAVALSASPLPASEPLARTQAHLESDA
jgi:O-antigen ligase